MIVVVYKAESDYRRRMIRKHLQKLENLEEVSSAVFILHVYDDRVIKKIRKILDYYAKKHILFTKGTMFLLFKYRFRKRSSKDFMAVKRVLERSLGLRVDKGVWIIPSKYSNVLKELLDHDVVIEKYYYIEPYSVQDAKELGDMYFEYLLKYVQDLEDKIMLCELKYKTLREYITRINVLQEKLLEGVIVDLLGKSRVIALLKKLGIFKKELLEKL